VASPSSEVFGQQVRAEVTRLSKLSKEAGIKAE
jgi:hypothetical protein